MRVFVLLWFSLLLTACSDSSTPAASNAVVAAAMPAKSGDIELGRKIYNFRCYFCHGYSGDARTLAATYLSPKPRDFSATKPDQLSREQMLVAVRDGRQGSAMKAFSGILQPDEIAAVVDFVRHEFMVSKAENTRYHTV